MEHVKILLLSRNIHKSMLLIEMIKRKIDFSMLLYTCYSIRHVYQVLERTHVNIIIIDYIINKEIMKYLDNLNKNHIIKKKTYIININNLIDYEENMQQYIVNDHNSINNLEQKMNSLTCPT
ncbi:MAG: hypothetical protein KAQ68_11425 [Clostridiales bacterium]|nr:hypothetical protein [Clostridiales bacterium]